jgi:DNA polymerase-3 subunit alpha
MVDIVGSDNVFLEIMPHDFDNQREVNIGKINLANDLGLPYMVTGDIHMPYAKWASTHLIVMMIATQQSVSSREKKKEGGEEVYGEEIDTIFLSSEEELLEMFESYHPDLPLDVVQEGLDNTVEFARRFRGYVIGKSPKLPKAKDVDVRDTLKQWCQQGRARRVQNWRTDGLTPEDVGKRNREYDNRHDYEFDVLERKGVLDYFYLVGDAVRWAKSDAPLPGDTVRKRPIRVGLGRGSAAGCLISYDIGITAIDPIQWGLKFERFLNPDREGLPDIDLDFETEIRVYPEESELPEDKRDDPVYAMDGRELVKEYLRRKYGEDRVADIIAYQTFAPRAVIQAVAATQDVDRGYIKKVTDSIGDTERDLQKLIADKKVEGKVIEGNQILKKFSEDEPLVWEHCLRLEDQIKADSRHAGGVLITPWPVSYFVPTQLGTDEESVVTAWADRADFPVVSDYGLVKLDALGVISLSKQELAKQLIGEYYDVDFEPNELPVLRDPYAADQEVIDGFVKGLTWEVFQFGGRGITQLLRHIRPTNALDLSIANALYRPGPIKIAFEYGDRKNGKIPVTYWHEVVRPVLEETLGLMAFQEQAMEICQRLGKFTGGQADAMRKAMSKLYRLPGDKAQQFMQGFKDQWVKGCRENGISEAVIEDVWTNKMLPLGDYLFNKSHSSSYALQAYQDMHIKTFYPLAFYASALTLSRKQKKVEKIEHLRAGAREAKIFDVEFLPPEINRSRRGWIIDGRNIRAGLVSINGMGTANAQEIEKIRTAKGEFVSYDDFVRKMPSNFSVGANVALAKAGAFDTIDDREYLLSDTREWDDLTVKYTIVMSCGCKKTRTVKAKAQLELDDAVNEKLEAVECKKHPDATVDKTEELDGTIKVAEFLKKFKTLEPKILRKPTDWELQELEREAMNVPLSMGSVVNRYHDFIEERIDTEEDLLAIPDKPKRKKVKGKTMHGSRCKCDECKASEVMIGGEVVGIKPITTKGGDKMAFVDLAFGSNTYNVTFFPDTYSRYFKLLAKPTAFLIAGSKSDRGDNSVIGFDIVDVTELAEEMGWKPAEPVSSKIKVGGQAGMAVRPRRNTIKIKTRKKVTA